MRKTKLLVSGVALATLVLAGCNSTATTGTPQGGSNTTTQASGKAAFDSLRALSEAVDKQSASAQSAHVTFTGTAGAESFKGEGDFNFAGDKTAMQMTMDTPEGAVTILLVDDTIFVKTPQEVEPGKTWIRVDLTGDNPIAKAMGGSLDQVKNSDPRETLKQLAESGQIKSVKEEELEGKKTSHYSIEVDVAKLQDKALGMDTAAIAELEKSGVKTIPVELWVNEENLPVRFVTEIPAAGQKAKVQADYSDWGKKVEITAPPAAEVAELPGS